MSGQQPTTRSVTEELKELGHQLTLAIKAIANSEELRNLGQELREGLKGLIAKVNEALAKARQREEVQQVGAHATRVVQSVRTGEAQQAIRAEVSAALRTANEQLRSLLEPKQSTPEQTTYTGVTVPLSPSEVEAVIAPAPEAPQSTTHTSSGNGHAHQG